MRRQAWTEKELLVVMNLYCRLPFGQCNSRNRLVKAAAETLGRTAGAVSRKLGNFASLDPRHQARGVGGLPNSSKLDRKIWSEFQKDWSAMAVESDLIFEDRIKNVDSNEALLIKSPAGQTESEATTKSRRIQNFFRRAVLSSYNFQCALTGLSIPELLIASHIIPWSENENRRADPTNGLCLNALHDKAFDRYLVTFDEEYRLLVSNKLKNNTLSWIEKECFVKMEGCALKLPHRFAPDPNALEQHRSRFFD